MYTGYFYHKTIRKYNVIIGSLFNDISIKQYDKNGNVTKTIEVPIAFAPKQHFIILLRQKTSLTDNGIKMIVPAMSFELTGYNYAPDRQQGHLQKMMYQDSTTGDVKMQYMPVAYDFDFQLNIYTKDIDDNLQIVEQILPFFDPTINFPVSDLPEMDSSITHDIAVELDGNSVEWSYEGSPEDSDRMIIHTMNLKLRGYLFKNTIQNPSGIIKNVINRYYDLDDYLDNDINKFLQKKVTQSVNPQSAGKNDPYTIDKTNEDFV